MDNIRTAIVRVARRVRTLEQLKQRQSRRTDVGTVGGGTPTVPKSRNQMAGLKVTNELLTQAKPFLQDFEKAKFKEFLAPLEMSGLKLLGDKRPFDARKAVNMWQLKRSTSNLVMHQKFTDSQALLEQTLGLLKRLTPPQVLGPKTDAATLQILEEYEREISKFKFEVPRYFFGEVPKVDASMSSDQFEQYIYFLTHSQVLYRGSSKLNGVVNDILLYTHKLDNHEFKSKRSVTTYNHMIKWYGYNKNQSLFARSLLVAMEKDGIEPDIHTINNLLKMVRVTGRIRSVSEPLKLVNKYLRLCGHYKLQANLVTWTRVYQVLTNVYLKEMFLNRVSMEQVPIPREMVYSVMDDYMVGCSGVTELVQFVERELRMPEQVWQEDSKIFNKVNYMAAKCATSAGEIASGAAGRCHDSHTNEHVIRGLRQNQNLSEPDKINAILWVYKGDSPAVIRYVVDSLSRIEFDIDGMHKATNKLVYDFQQLSSYEKTGDVISSMKSHISSFDAVMAKLQYFKRRIEPKDWEIPVQLDGTNTFVVPEKYLRRRHMGVIKAINRSKLVAATSLGERLREREVVARQPRA
ncbi:mitochondrial translation initiation protein [Yamadazyma tenuis]|uniref:Mitochondrial 15S rRNA processing factor CCM1 n=1 Tax=Candida tenuis (strain ATCC 10573 / BCRC 21748 / CBS 615 / JCM 9827 / NBRC 10315 / NRRL Y-1498 / VKM Y-70) TaxID=590646 RepID=G3B7M8_CANTC|nr:uncharacterized protein CANTEDRAFT_135592 [Yamadazyma tenuis ATCC 10573]EGV61652.1 hypothetical protein CANTEDRAFT_135592 [Yamadazyma tenuis ATCC 10573]WEJ92881.1 mitochondrial translation initiation protein [Yamadazyma tenuis]